MKDLFQGYYAPKVEVIQKLWENALFVFDTNVLLNFYRYSEETTESLFQLFEKLKNRIFIPYQVAYEYHKNIVNVIAQQIPKYEETVIALNKAKSLLETKKNHPFLSKLFMKRLLSFLKNLT